MQQCRDTESLNRAWRSAFMCLDSFAFGHPTQALSIHVSPRKRHSDIRIGFGRSSFDVRLPGSCHLSSRSRIDSTASHEKRVHP
jgi:hypothetical protein